MTSAKFWKDLSRYLSLPLPPLASQEHMHALPWTDALRMQIQNSSLKKPYWLFGVTAFLTVIMILSRKIYAYNFIIMETFPVSFIE